MDGLEVMRWLKEGEVRGNCMLTVVRSWDPSTCVLLCNESGHSRQMHAEELSALSPKVDRWIEFDHREIAALVSILPQISGERHSQLRFSMLELKRSFGGRSLTAEQYQQLVAQVQKAGSGSSSKGESPERTTSPPAPKPATTSGRKRFARPSSAFAQRLLKASASSSSEAASKVDSKKQELEEQSSSSPSLSFAERLAKRRASGGTQGGATPAAPTS